MDKARLLNNQPVRRGFRLLFSRQQRADQKPNAGSHERAKRPKKDRAKNHLPGKRRARNRRSGMIRRHNCEEHVDFSEDKAGNRKRLGKVASFHQGRRIIAQRETVETPRIFARQLPRVLDLCHQDERFDSSGSDGDRITAILHERMARGLGDVHPGVLVNLEWATPSYMATLGIQRWHKKQSETAKT